MCDIKLWPISFFKIDLASTPIERASSMYRKTYSYTSVPSLLMADLIQTSGRTGSRSQVIPEVSSSGLSP
jgi:hypothetical protein